MVNVTIVSCNKITIIGHDSLFYRIYWKFVVNTIDLVLDFRRCAHGTILFCIINAMAFDMFNVCFVHLRLMFMET